MVLLPWSCTACLYTYRNLPRFVAGTLPPASLAQDDDGGCTCRRAAVTFHFTAGGDADWKSVRYLWCSVAWYFTCKSLVDVQTLPCPGRAMAAVHKIPRPTMARQPWPDMHNKKQHSQQKSCEPATPAKHEEQHTLLLCKRHVGFCKEACSGLLQFSLHRTSWTNLSSPTSLIICILPGHIGCCYPRLGSRTCCAWLAAPNDALWHRNARQQRSAFNRPSKRQ